MAATFEAFDVSLELVRSLRQLIAAVAAHDPDLARQLRRAGASIPLNIHEGNRRAGRDRTQLFRVAAGSATEVVAGLRVAEAWGHVDAAASASALALADRVLAMLWRLTH
jgi:four helix bundle protein